MVHGENVGFLWVGSYFFGRPKKSCTRATYHVFSLFAIIRREHHLCLQAATKVNSPPQPPRAPLVAKCASSTEEHHLCLQSSTEEHHLCLQAATKVNSPPTPLEPPLVATCASSTEEHQVNSPPPPPPNHPLLLHVHHPPKNIIFVCKQQRR